MKKKKILIMNLTPRWWMLHYSSQFSNELFKKDKIKLKVAIASYHNSILYDKGINFIKIRTKPNLFSFIFDSLNIFYHIYFIIKIIIFKPNIVHFLDNHPWYVFYSRLFKILWYEIYVTQHDPTLHSGENSTLLWKVATNVNKKLRNISDKLFVHWDKLKQEVIKKYNINKNRVVSIKHWAYTFFNKWAKWLKVQNNTFLFFGRIVDYKWLDDLLDSLIIVKERFPDFKLIISWPWELAKYEKLLNKFKNNIEIFNFNIEPEDAYKYFEISEFVVLPYKDATWSWVIPVSYSFSKSVLITNVWELTSVVEDWKTGFVIEPNNSKELWKKIIYMLENKVEVKELWINGKNFSDTELSWKDIIYKIY